MSVLDDAQAAAAAIQTVITDLQNTPPQGGPVEYSAQVVSNADGSVIVTLTPTAPAAVSSDSGSGTVADTSTPGAGDVGPGPTGQ